MQHNPEKKKHVPARRARVYEKPPITKQVWEPGTMLFPLPVVMITSADADGRPNICTVAWTGIVCSDPPMLSISLRKERYSHGLITAAGEFVVNMPSVRQVRATDYCGVVSGRDVDKFAQAKLTPAPSSIVKPPLILECPLNLECRTTQVIELGSHDLFLANIVAVQVNEDTLAPSGRLALEKIGLAAFAHGGYYALGKKLGFFGYSVQKKQAKKGA